MAHTTYLKQPLTVPLRYGCLICGSTQPEEVRDGVEDWFWAIRGRRIGPMCSEACSFIASTMSTADLLSKIFGDWRKGDYLASLSAQGLIERSEDEHPAYMIREHILPVTAKSPTPPLAGHAYSATAVFSIDLVPYESESAPCDPSLHL